MGGRATPSAAQRFMHRCRLTTTAFPRTPRTFTTRNSSTTAQPRSTSRYAPSTFNKPYTSPIASPSPMSSGSPNYPGPNPNASATPVPHPNTQPTSPTAVQLWSRRRKAQSTAIPPPVTQLAFGNRLRRRFGFQLKNPPTAPPDAFNVWNNPYRTHKNWPPNFDTMTRTQQLAYEKIYKRRMAIKWERPRFMKLVTLIQNSLIIFVVVGAVLVYDTEEENIFDGVRAWMWTRVRNSEFWPERIREKASGNVEWYEARWKTLKEGFFEIVPQQGMVPGRGVAVDPREVEVPWAQRRRDG